MKQLVYFLALVAVVVTLAVVGVVAISMIAKASEEIVDNTPSQAVMLDSYRELAGTTMEEAETTKILAEADATVRMAENDHLRAMATYLLAEVEMFKAKAAVAQPLVRPQPNIPAQNTQPLPNLGLWLLLGAGVVLVLLILRR